MKLTSLTLIQDREGVWWWNLENVETGGHSTTLRKALKAARIRAKAEGLVIAYTYMDRRDTSV